VCSASTCEPQPTKRFDLKNHLEADSVESTDWGFDYVPKKGSENYFVEVKTNKAQLRKYQRKMMKAKEYGFIPMIIRPKVSITAKSEDMTIDYI